MLVLRSLCAVCAPCIVRCGYQIPARYMVLTLTDNTGHLIR